ncbi:5-carboxymethyl-2-hydroxymuconate semialdehyde dehydrogenase [Litorimonas cladophorae]|uniref:5-carboxymethyl-2-hydroxymuconate semialdehyde dehydrogenase n=1 Tax=Litorimonas cladophorae TaxID=1220491 RepID=A0A918KIC0_9PROT|nr:5-carboxymethyl-2-hydroxymuconate semialdehyde dehydrogenase [Litorimonas cladophorae]GGX61962.1 5-carboxymethyl-2-hydroxymuconate semialdehyde dehydrogenase [Litorimonas cladophorae]
MAKVTFKKTDLEKRVAKARKHMARFRKEPLGHFINGRLVKGKSKETFENITPVDNSRLGDIWSGTAADIDAAANAAHKAFLGGWRDLDGAKRREIMYAIADGIEARADEIAMIESMDTGQPIRFMQKAAIRGAANFRFFGDKAVEAGKGLSLPAEHHHNFTTRHPLGAVGVITPWNTPFMLSTWKIAPALASGCTVVQKPAEFSPYTAMLLCEIAYEAGLPKGVLNVVNGLGESAGKALTEHEHIKAIAFVGESSTGSHIQRQAAPTLKRLHLELGGKNPCIVFDDADMERALDAAVFMQFSLNGERCTSSTRLLVQDSIYDSFTAKVAARIRRINVGHPLDPNTEIGPLIHPTHHEKVMSYFEIAKEDGATVAVGGARKGKEGCYVKPTLFTNATNDMRIAQEEIFGPVLTAIPFKDEAEAIKIANDTEYGLTGYVWTENSAKGMRVARELEAGMIWINSENNRHLPAPFGGMKASGIGRDGGDWSFDFYMETKNTCIAYGTHSIPKLGT